MTINQNMIAICHSYPTSLSAATNLSQVIPASVLIPIHQLSTEQSIQKDGMKNWWYIPHPPTSGSHTINVSETLTLTESVKRKLTLVCTWIQAGYTYG